MFEICEKEGELLLQQSIEEEKWWRTIAVIRRSELLQQTYLYKALLLFESIFARDNHFCFDVDDLWY